MLWHIQASRHSLGVCGSGRPKKRFAWCIWLGTSKQAFIRFMWLWKIQAGLTVYIVSNRSETQSCFNRYDCLKKAVPILPAIKLETWVAESSTSSKYPERYRW